MCFEKSDVHFSLLSLFTIMAEIMEEEEKKNKIVSV